MSVIDDYNEAREYQAEAQGAMNYQQKQFNQQYSKVQAAISSQAAIQQESAASVNIDWKPIAVISGVAVISLIVMLFLVRRLKKA